MLPQFLAVAVGGAAGSVARHALSGWAGQMFGTGPHLAGTLAVNLIGCFAIGLVYRLSDSVPALAHELRPLLTSGFLGGFTTFSAFGLEIFQQLKAHNTTTAILYAAANVLGGLALTWAGYLAGGAAGR
jgi:CrcB protein